MARPKKETDFTAMAMKRYEELVAKRNEMDEELKGLQGYLKAVGETKAKVGRKPREKRSQGRKGSATQVILSLISGSEKGISIDEMMKQTGLKRQTVNGVLNRMKREKKIKAVKRGVYARQSSVGGSGKKKQVQRKKQEAGPESVKVVQKKVPSKAKKASKGTKRAKRNKSAEPAEQAKTAKKSPATETILSLVEKAENGISVDQIMTETGFGRLTVFGVLARMKKAGKVKGAGRGIYVKA